MKHCINCEYFSKEPSMNQVGQHYMQFLCKKDDCSDPVTGDPLPCNIARKEEVFCGLRGKFYLLRKEVSEEDPPKQNLILMSKNNESCS